MKTRPSMRRANAASTVATSCPMSAATAAIVGIFPRVLIDRAMAMRTSRSRSASGIRDVLHEVELVVAGGADVAHARLLHDAARRDVLGKADRDDLPHPELAKAVIDAGARGFRGKAAAPPLLRALVRDLDFRSLSRDVDEPAGADDLAGRAELDRPETESMLALVTDETRDRAARAFDRRGRAAGDEAHRLVVAEYALVERLGVADVERADQKPRRLDREREHARSAIG